MKKKIASIALAIALVFALQTVVNAVYVSFYADTNTNQKVGYMEGVSERNGTMELSITDSNTRDDYDPNDMQREGYEFAGWEEFGDHNSNVLTIDNENKTIAFSANGDGTPRNVGATWTAIEYKIDLDLGEGGTSDNPETYTIEDDDITLTDPTRAGFNFIGWEDENGDPIDGAPTIPGGSTGDRKFVAAWEAIVYTITYDYDGGEAEGNPETYTADDEFTLVNPTKPGYTFAGWEEFGDPVGIEYKIEKGTTGDLELKATWTKDEYTIEYDLDGGEVEEANPETYTVDDEFTLNNPTKEGFKFLGWTNEDEEELGEEVKVEKGTTGNLKFIALWEEESANPKTSDNVFVYVAVLVVSVIGLAVVTKKLFIK